MTVEFREPPSPKGGPSANKYGDVAEALKERPGEWAMIVAGGHHNLVPRIKAGTIPAFRPAGAYEATARSNESGRFDVYARFVGDADD